MRQEIAYNPGATYFSIQVCVCVCMCLCVNSSARILSDISVILTCLPYALQRIRPPVLSLNRYICLLSSCQNHVLYIYAMATTSTAHILYYLCCCYFSCFYFILFYFLYKAGRFVCASILAVEWWSFGCYLNTLNFSEATVKLHVYNRAPL